MKLKIMPEKHIQLFLKGDQTARICDKLVSMTQDGQLLHVRFEDIEGKEYHNIYALSNIEEVRIYVE